MYLLGIDVGTTSVKTILCNSEGEILYSTSEENDLYSKHPGWAEEEANQWWKNVKKTIRDCIDGFGIKGGEIQAIGVTGMVPALVLLDKNGEVIRRSIQQNDARTVSEIDLLKEKLDEDEFFELTGGSINQQLIGPKIMWLKENEPDSYERIDKILGSYDFINFKLTGNHTVEHNWALESGLLNIESKEWISDILEICRFDPEWLPRVVSSDEVTGTVKGRVAEETGLEEGTPVVGGIADHVSSAFAAGLKEEGDLNIKIGGAGDILYSLDQLVTDPRLFIDYHPIPEKYMINGCMAASGSLLKWFKNEFYQYEQKVELNEDEQSTFDYLNRKASSVQPGSDGLVILPYFLGEKTPLHDPQAKGVIFGLGLHHKKEHIYRGLMESVAYGFKHHVDLLEKKDLEIKRVIATDGGARSSLWRQIIADVLGKQLIYITDHPGSSLGAAFVAGMGVGKFESWSEIDKFIDIEGTTEPNPKITEKYSNYYQIYRKLYGDLKNRFVELSELN